MTPAPAQIKALREANHLTQTVMAARLYLSLRAYQAYEWAETPMPEGYWELMQIKAPFHGKRGSKPFKGQA